MVLEIKNDCRGRIERNWGIPGEGGTKMKSAQNNRKVKVVRANKVGANTAGACAADWLVEQQWLRLAGLARIVTKTMPPVVEE